MNLPRYRGWARCAAITEKQERTPHAFMATMAVLSPALSFPFTAQAFPTAATCTPKAIPAKEITRTLQRSCSGRMRDR